MCMNRVMFKQFLQANAMDFCQIDSARMGGVNEILSVYFMAKKFNGIFSFIFILTQTDQHLLLSCLQNIVKVCPHAGGVGLCEMVQHLQMWDFTSVSCTKADRYVEYVDQQHEQFVNPTHVQNAHYLAPKAPGYSTELKAEAIKQFEYPNGTEWQKMIKNGTFTEVKY